MVADKNGDCKTHLNFVQTGDWSENFVVSSSDTEELEKQDNRCWTERDLGQLDSMCGVKALLSHSN